MGVAFIALLLLSVFVSTCITSQPDWPCASCASNSCTFGKTKSEFICVKNARLVPRIRNIFDDQAKCLKIVTTRLTTTSTTTRRPPRLHSNTTLRTKPTTRRKTTTTRPTTTRPKTRPTAPQPTAGSTSKKATTTRPMTRTIARQTATIGTPTSIRPGTSAHTEIPQADEASTILPIKFSKSGVYYNEEILIPLWDHSQNFAKKFIRTLCRISWELQFYLRKKKMQKLPIRKMLRFNPMNEKEEIFTLILAEAKRLGLG